MSKLLSNQSQSHHIESLEKQITKTIHQIISQMNFLGFVQNLNQYRYFTSIKGKKSNNFEVIEGQWTFSISPQYLKISLSYSCLRLLGKLLKVKGNRFLTQINLLLKVINLRSKNDGAVYMVSKEGVVLVKVQRLLSNLSKDYYGTIKLLVLGLQSEFDKNFAIMIPYLAFPLEQLIKNNVSEFYCKKKETHSQILKLYKRQFEQYRISRKNSIKQLFNDFEDFHETVYKNLSIIAGQLNFFQKHTNVLTEEEKQTIKQTLQKQLTEEKVYTEEDSLDHVFESRILTGISNIKKLDQRLIISTGAHSQIKVNRYEFDLIKTVNGQALLSQSKFELNKNSQNTVIIHIKSQLAAKIPKQKEVAINCFTNQIATLLYIRASRCPYIGKYFLESDQRSQLFMPAYKENLRQVLTQYKKNKIVLSFSLQLKLYLEIVRGVKFLSSRNILHRDLKLSNIMITRNMLAKIIDFGSSINVFGCQDFQVQEEQLLGTEGYYFKYEQCDEIIKNLYTKREYEQHTHFDSYSLAKMLEKMFLFQKKSEPILHPSGIINESFEYILGRCSDQNPDDRLNSSQISVILDLIAKIYHEQTSDQ